MTFHDACDQPSIFFDKNSNTPTDNEHDTPFHNKSTWNLPKDRERTFNTFLDAVKLDITTGKPKTIHDLTATERQAIRQLKQRQGIIIKPADKGSGTVVTDKTWYIDECNRQLTDTKLYQFRNENITADIQKCVTLYVDRMHNDKLISDKTRQYLKQSLNQDDFTFYPKYINRVMQAALLIHLIAIPLNACLTSSTTSNVQD